MLSVLVAGCVLLAGCSASSSPDTAAGDDEATVFDAKWQNLRAEHISRAAVRTFYRVGWFAELTHDAQGSALTEDQAVATMGNTFFLSPDGSGEYVGGINAELAFQWLLHHEVNLDSVSDGPLKTILANYYDNSISEDVALSQLRSALRVDTAHVLQMVQSFVTNFLPPWLSNALSLLARSENVASGASATNPLATSETAFALPLLLGMLLLIVLVMMAIVILSGRPLPQVSFNTWPSPGQRPLDPTNPIEIAGELAANVELEVTLSAMHNSPQWQAYMQSLQALASHTGVTISPSIFDDPLMANSITEMIENLKESYARCKELAVQGRGSAERCRAIVFAGITLLMQIVASAAQLLAEYPEFIGMLDKHVDRIIQALTDLWTSLLDEGFTEAELAELWASMCVLREIRSGATVDEAEVNCLAYNDDLDD